MTRPLEPAPATAAPETAPIGHHHEHAHGHTHGLIDPSIKRSRQASGWC